MGNTSTKLFLAPLNGKSYETYTGLHDAVHDLLMKSGDLFPRGYDAAMLIDVETRRGKIYWDEGRYTVILQKTMAVAN